MNARHEDIDLIDNCLHLGNRLVATDVCKLFARKITDVLTVMDEPIDVDKRIAGIRYHHIDAEDNARQDLLTHFDNTYDIIDGCRQLGHSVLVHCRAGVSRSAAVVIAYLMRKRQLPFHDALELVRNCRPIIRPNEGFMDQLRLFERMDYRLNANDRQFRQWLWRLCANRDRLDYYYERRTVAEWMTPGLHWGQQLVCADCEFALFSQIHINSDFDEMYGSGAAPVTGLVNNQRIYIEPKEWMAELSAPDHSYGFIKCRCDAIVAEYELLTPYEDPLVANPLSSKHQCFKIRLMRGQTFRDQITDTKGGNRRGIRTSFNASKEF
ncbi:unnamed protein product [Medioppia subpectinata]|uniref:protein-tyrosine-phosphatase n=1 Tax=Medioppia subpectinata TaxID=1979941 RepID=A0A7R9KJU3_9ACAR|nr:unnamed protein product [Medioppia subpectinata]CAG2103495.1 unnamed protein product [Medioppia subpectinata]